MDKKIILVIGLLIIILVVIFFWKKSSSTLSVNLSKGYSSVEEPELIKKNQVNNIINQREDEPELNDNKIPSPFIDKDDQEPELIKSYTIEEISQHNNKEDCWLAINGKVYNVTDFIARGDHPGGDTILQGCGQDATSLYEARPIGSGTPHSDRARDLLSDYYIGDFK